MSSHQNGTLITKLSNIESSLISCLAPCPCFEWTMLVRMLLVVLVFGTSYVVIVCLFDCQALDGWCFRTCLLTGGWIVLRIVSPLMKTINFVLFRTTRPSRRRIAEANAQGERSPRDSNDNLIAAEEEEEEEEGEELSDDLEYIDLEQDLNRLLIERLFAPMPNLWLQPELISCDYIDSLPTWQHELPPSLPDEPETSQTEGFTSAISSSDCSDNDDEDNDKNKCKSTSNVKAVTSEEWCEAKTTKFECQAAGGSNERVEKHMIVPKLSAKHQKLLYVRQEKAKKRLEARRRRKAEREAVGEMTKLDVGRPSWMLLANECSICLDCYGLGETILGLACGHNYHGECIVEWLARANHCCPICRWPSYRFKHPRHQQQLVKI